MLPLLSFEEFLTARLNFSFCRGTKQRRSNLRHTHSQKSVCQQTWVWSRLHPWYRKSKAAAETQHSAEVRGPFAAGKMGQEETAIIRSLKSLVYTSPGCRASFPAARSVSRLAVPASVPVAGSTRDTELQGTEVPKVQGTETAATLGGCLGWQLAAATCRTSREPVGTERMGKYVSGVFWRKFYSRDVKLAMDPQDQSLPLGACPFRAA